ncbi:MAG TPA: type II CAAX endopeptidase family protein [Candidatus Acidoferrum sp.]|nr:type II CAAX endopeptidase family protein [Candidatus Acidoferrum sp.]
MDNESFGTPPEAQRSANPSASGFPEVLFLNKTGLRAGWRLLIYIAIFFVLWSGSVIVLGQFFRPEHGAFSLAFQFLGEYASFLAAFLGAWIMSLIEQRPVGVYGLPARGAFGKLFWQGSLFGLCEILGLVGLIAAFRGYSFGSLVEHGADIAKWALLWSVSFLGVALFEEFLFRGYALYTLAEGIGFWPAAVLLAGVFGWVHKHNSGENWIGVAGVVFVGLFWAFTLKRTGTLWFALGMHASFDFGETFLISVPDSGMIFPGHLSNATLHGPNWMTGGTPGPEASLFDFLILAVFFFVFDRLYPARQAQRYVPPAN